MDTIPHKRMRGLGCRWASTQPVAQSHRVWRAIMASMKYVGLDVHKDSIAVGIADEGPGKVRYYGTIPMTSEALRDLVRRLGPPGTLRLIRRLEALGLSVEVKPAA
jgi:hypothetical protein